MKMNKIAVSLALVAVALSGTASAATYNMGFLSSAPSFQLATTFPASSFTDTFNFSIAAASDVSASVNNFPVSLYSLNIYDINNLSMSLNGGASVANGGSTTSFNLAAGNYAAVVTGNATGMQGGIYGVSMFAQPAAVPVPAAAWLLGSGLIGLVAVARRKEQA